VILAARTDKYVESRAFGLQGTHDREAKADLWRGALRSVLQRLNAAGIPVVIVHPIPTLPRAPRECPVARVLLGRCYASISRTEADAGLARATAIEDEAASNASTLALADELCPNGRCAATRDGVIQYRDAEHLSVDGALLLTATFSRAVAAASGAAPRAGAGPASSAVRRDPPRADG
jgi:hypothetical protein